MDLYLDTADVDEIREIASWGVLSGVTTNPTLLSREEGDPREILREITKIVEGPVSAEVTALDAEGMVREGLELQKIADNKAYNVVAFTATQIPDIEDRVYPAELAGSLYPEGIPILPEEDLE